MHRQRLAALVRDTLRHRIGVEDIGNDHGRALRRQRPRIFGADALRRARDDGHFSLQPACIAHGNLLQNFTVYFKTVKLIVYY